MFGDQVVENRNEVAWQPVAANTEYLRRIGREKHGCRPGPVRVAFANVRAGFCIDLDGNEVLVDQRYNVLIRIRYGLHSRTSFASLHANIDEYHLVF